MGRLVVLLVTLLGVVALGHPGPAIAQEATPSGQEATPSDTGAAPEGLVAQVLAQGVIGDAPRLPAHVDLGRLVFPPGARTPPGPDPGPSLTFVESGVLTIRLDGPATVTRAATAATPGAAVPATPDAVVTLRAGDGIFIPAGTGFQVRNEGQEPAAFLVARIFPIVGDFGAYQTLARGEWTALPAGPLTFALVRVTFAPGAEDPAAGPTGPLLAYVEQGAFTETVTSGEVQVLRAPALGTPAAGAEPTVATAGATFELTAGDAVVEQAGIVRGVRNAEDESGVALLVALVPAEAATAATPVATPSS